MRFNLNIRCYFLALLTLSSSCEYEPTKVNFKTIEPVTNVTISIDLVTSPDTIIIIEPIRIYFDIEVEDSTRVHVTANLGNSIYNAKYDTKKDAHYFEIDPYHIQSGTYLFEATAVAYSGSGSLADLYGFERVISSVSRVAIVDTREPVEMSLDSAVAKDGSLFLYWGKYPNHNLRKYKLEKLAGHHGNAWITFELDSTSRSFKDITYVGGIAFYRLNTHTTEGGQVRRGYEFEFNSPLPAIDTFRTISQGTLELRWRRCQYPENFGGYEVYGEYGKIGETHSVDDTVVLIDDFYFGKAHRVFIKTISKVDGFSSEFPPFEFSGEFPIGFQGMWELVHWGNPFPSVFTELYFRPASIKIYFLAGSYLGVIESGAKVDSVHLSLSVDEKDIGISPNGEHVYYRHSSHLAGVDLSNFVITRYHYPRLTWTEGYTPYFPLVTDQNEVWMSNLTSVALYNPGDEFIKDSVMLEGEGDVSGLYFLNDQSTVLVRTSNKAVIISYDGSQLSRVNDFAVPQGYFPGFDVAQPSILYFSNGQTLQSWTVDGTFIAETELPIAIYNIQFDNASTWLGGMNNEGDKYIIYNFVTGELVREIRTPGPHYYDFVLNNRTLYYFYGRSLSFN